MIYLKIGIEVSEPLLCNKCPYFGEDQYGALECALFDVQMKPDARPDVCLKAEVK